MKTPTDDDLLDALRLSDPASAITLSTSDAAAIVRRARPSRPRRHRWAVGTAALAVVVVLGVPAGAVATGFVARTGWFGSPNPGADRTSVVSTESDGTEWIDLDAADARDVIASLLPYGVPLAPGTTGDALTERVSAALTATGGLAQETLVRKTFEYEVYRDWIGAWIGAHRVGDAAGRARAAAVLEEAAAWPATAETDGGGVADTMRAFARRIAAGDPEAAQALAQVENAPGWDGVDRSLLIGEIADEVSKVHE